MIRKPKFCEICGSPMRHQPWSRYDVATGNQITGEDKGIIECSSDPSHIRLYWMLVPFGWQTAGWAKGL